MIIHHLFLLPHIIYVLAGSKGNPHNGLYCSVQLSKSHASLLEASYWPKLSNISPQWPKVKLLTFRLLSFFCSFSKIVGTQYTHTDDIGFMLLVLEWLCSEKSHWIPGVCRVITSYHPGSSMCLGVYFEVIWEKNLSSLWGIFFFLWTAVQNTMAQAPRELYFITLHPQLLCHLICLCLLLSFCSPSPSFYLLFLLLSLLFSLVPGRHGDSAFP